MKKFNFVYLSTNKINGKQYIGDHSTDKLDDNYIGSGRPLFEKAKKKYGKENFKREILEFFPSKEEAFNAQEKYIKEYNTLKPNGYNISPTGGHGIKNCWNNYSKTKLSNSLKGKIRSEETKQKMRKPKSELHKTSLKEAWKKRRIENPTSDETKIKISNFHKGRKRSKESCEKMSKTWLGRNHSNESNEKNRQSHLGKKHSPESILKISKKYECPYCHILVNKGNLNRWHNENCKKNYL